MIRNKLRIGAGNNGRKHGQDAVRSRLKLRPALMELEGRALLSTFTVNHGATSLVDVGTHGNAARAVSGLSDTHSATLARRRLSSRASTSQILNQTFNGNGFPSGWQKFLPGNVVESPQTFLTITDSTGLSAGIAANATKTVPFNPVGVTTTITAQINSVSPSPQLGNAIFGLLGPNGPAHPAELAAGIDAQGDVFIVEYGPNQKIKETIVPVGVDTGYTGGPVTMICTIKPTGVQITAGSTTFREFSFSKDLNNFSMKTAFRNGAIPALVAASQPSQQGGAASFESISVSTAVGNRLRKAPAPGPRRSGSPSFTDPFNGSGGVPKNWMQILGTRGTSLRSLTTSRSTTPPGKRRVLRPRPSQSIPWGS